MDRECSASTIWTDWHYSKSTRLWAVLDFKIWIGRPEGDTMIYDGMNHYIKFLHPASPMKNVANTSWDHILPPRWMQTFPGGILCLQKMNIYIKQKGNSPTNWTMVMGSVQTVNLKENMAYRLYYPVSRMLHYQRKMELTCSISVWTPYWLLPHLIGVPALHIPLPSAMYRIHWSPDLHFIGIFEEVI